MTDDPRARGLLRRPDRLEISRVAELLRRETVGGILLLVATVLALAWANSPWQQAYRRLLEVHLGPGSLGLNLTISHWAGDGLLAVFFFVVGLELAHEFRHGDLRDPARATVPVVAAAAGVAVPALIYLAVQWAGDGRPVGWAVPTATDIAFALAVLAVIGTHLPSSMRSFLLTLAVVDDLIAIAIIALFYTDRIRPVLLALAVIAVALFAAALRVRFHPWWLMAPLGIAAWALMLSSGVHATIAGVLLGLAVPDAAGGSGRTLPGHLEHLLRPLSAGVCVPVFAFCSAGVSVAPQTLRSAFGHPVTLGVLLGLVAGKATGVFGGTWLCARLTRARLDDQLTWSDVFGLSLLGGIGFTVSLLIGELAFGSGSAADEQVRLGILSGSVLSAVLAAVVLRRRNRAYRRMAELERVHPAL